MNLTVPTSSVIVQLFVIAYIATIAVIVPVALISMGRMRTKAAVLLVMPLVFGIWTIGLLHLGEPLFRAIGGGVLFLAVYGGTVLILGPSLEQYYRRRRR